MSGTIIGGFSGCITINGIPTTRDSVQLDIYATLYNSIYGALPITPGLLDSTGLVFIYESATDNQQCDGPIIVPDVSSGRVDICKGDSVMLFTLDDSTASDILWLPSAGLSCSTCWEPIASPDTTTLYVGYVIKNGFVTTFEGWDVRVNQQNSISGEIEDSLGNSIPGIEVFLIQYDSSTNVVSTTDNVLTDGNGFYQFSGFADGQYYIKAAPDSATYPNLMPTYYRDALIFQDAVDWLRLESCDSIGNLKIELINGNNPGGPGFISGLVNNGAGKTGTPAANTLIIIADGQGKPVNHTYTNQNGFFEFRNIPIATYEIWVDQPLIDNSTAPEVALTQSNPEVRNLAFTLEPTVLRLDGFTGLSSNMGNLIDFSLYPNPAEKTVRINFDNALNGLSLIELLDINGRKVTTIEHQIGKGVDMDLSSLSKGLYFVRVNSETESIVKKLIIK